MKNKKCKFKFFAISISIFMFLTGCSNFKSNIESTDEVNANSSKNENEEKKECSIVFAGDVLLHDDQLKAEYNADTNTYNFDEFFKNVKPYISEADLAVCNSETTFLGQGSIYSGYPSFNSPTEILSSLKDSGFDILASAHNHILDYGYDGFVKTAKSIKDNNLDLIGIKNNDNDKNYLVKEINDIKIGITNYSYCSKKGNSYTFNETPLPASLENRINLFDDNNIDLYLDNMKNTIENMKKDGAEYIVFYIHWGIEYNTTHSPKQRYLAEKLNSLGVDAIIGSHPHVVQPIESITNETSKKKTLVCYSLGNFISNQRTETMGNEKSEDGLMVKLNLRKDNNNEVVLDSYDTEPTWVNKYTDDSSKVHYEIIKTKDIINNSNSENYSTEVFNKIQNSLNSTNSIINKR